MENHFSGDVATAHYEKQGKQYLHLRDKVIHNPFPTSLYVFVYFSTNVSATSMYNRSSWHDHLLWEVSLRPSHGSHSVMPAASTDNTVVERKQRCRDGVMNEFGPAGNVLKP